MSSSPDNRALLIAGPTASGKSALALAVARARDGVVINTDSMQVYRDLRVLTARPTVEEEAQAPHRLYGTVDAAVNFSAGAWVEEAARVLAEVRTQGKAADLHRRLRTILRGADARALGRAARRRRGARRCPRASGRDGPEALHAQLALVDPVSAARLNLRDRTRIARALEVVEATGRSLTDWHSEGLPPLLPPEGVTALFLAPERDELYARIDARFGRMLDEERWTKSRHWLRAVSIRCCRR